MNFHAVAQLCSDFWLAPTLVTSHGLKKMYESVECLGVLKIEKTAAELLAEKLLALQALKGIDKDKEEEADKRRRSRDRGDGKKVSMARRKQSVWAGPPTDTLPVPGQTRKSAASAASKDSNEEADTHHNRRGSAATRMPSGEAPVNRQSRKSIVHHPHTPTDKDEQGPAKPARRLSQVLREKSASLKRGGTLPASSPPDGMRTTTTGGSVVNGGSVFAFEDVVKKAAKNKNWPMSFPWQGIMSLLDGQDSTEEMCKPIFGYQAVMELIFKIGYAHLSFYGNMQQKSMSSWMQAVWILTYLRFIIESLRKSLDKRGLDAAAEEKQFGALSRAVRSITPDLFELSEVPDHTEHNLPKSTFRDTVVPTPEGLGLLSSKENPYKRQHEVGDPCVVEGICKVCKLPADANKGWGNLRCYGCSKLDTLSLAQHPLSPLLFDRQADERPEAVLAPEEAIRARRSSLSPPPFRDSDSFKDVDGEASRSAASRQANRRDS